jgi:hypothetical protein
MNISALFTSFDGIIYLKQTIAAIVPLIAPAIISMGQCTPTIIRERFISIIHGRNIYQIFLKPAKNRATVNAKLTVA